MTITGIIKPKGPLPIIEKPSEIEPITRLDIFLNWKYSMSFQKASIIGPII